MSHSIFNHAVFIAESFHFVSNHFRERIEKLIEYGFSVHVIAKDDHLFQTLPDDVFVKKLPSSNLTTPVDFILIQAYLIEVKPILVHSFGKYMSLLTSIALKFVEVPSFVASINDFDFEVFSEVPLLHQLTDWFYSRFNTSIEDSTSHPSLLRHILAPPQLIFTNTLDSQQNLENIFNRRTLPENPITIKCLNGNGYGVNFNEVIINQQHYKSSDTNYLTKTHLLTIFNNSDISDETIDILSNIMAQRIDSLLTIVVLNKDYTSKKLNKLRQSHSINILKYEKEASSVHTLFQNQDIYLELNSHPDPYYIMEAAAYKTAILSTSSKLISFLLNNENNIFDEEETTFFSTGATTVSKAKFADVTKNILDRKEEITQAKDKVYQLAKSRFNKDEIDNEVLETYDRLLRKTKDSKNLL